MEFYLDENTRLPSEDEIIKASKELEVSVNKLISEFKEKYPSPYVTMVHGGYYKVYVEQNMTEYFKLNEETRAKLNRKALP
mgnify:CR=1 FL=1